jgi:acyl carrier protein
MILIMSGSIRRRILKSYEQIVNELKKLIEAFVPGDAKLDEHTEFVADLELDSVQVMEFLPEVEDRFDILIPLNNLDEVKNVADLANVVMQIIKKDK